MSGPLRGSVRAVCAGILAASGTAWAQEGPPEQPASDVATASGTAHAASDTGDPAGLPPGHPQTDSEPESDTGDPAGLPPGHPQTDAEPQADNGDSAGVPPGHPPIAVGGAMRTGLRKDRNAVDPSVPPGTVQILIADSHEQAVEGKKVRLEIVRESPGEGKSHSDRAAITPSSGVVTFSGLATDSAHRYRVLVEHDSAVYRSTPFALAREAGQRVVLHVYPVTSDISKAIIASMATVYVEPREEVFQFQVMVNIVNLGSVSWAPRGMVLALPEGASAFVGEENMTGLQMVLDPRDGVRLKGAVGPGEHSVIFSFQVGRQNSPEQGIRLGLPPHMIEGRVMVESSPGMTVTADGFDAPVAASNREGQRIQVLGFRLTESGTPPTELSLRLSGLPVESQGRWIALVVALGLGGVGLGVGRRGSQGVAREDIDEARRILLDEIVDIERDHAENRIGPQTYEQARRELVDALSRLEALSSSAASKRVAKGG